MKHSDKYTIAAVFANEAMAVAPTLGKRFTKTACDKLDLDSKLVFEIATRLRVCESGTVGNPGTFKSTDNPFNKKEQTVPKQDESVTLNPKSIPKQVVSESKPSRKLGKAGRHKKYDKPDFVKKYKPNSSHDYAKGHSARAGKVPVQIDRKLTVYCNPGDEEATRVKYTT